MDKLEVWFSPFHGMQRVFPEDKSSTVPGALQAKAQVWLALWGGTGMWVDPVWEKRLCPELFHSMIISVKAKKTIWKPVLFIHS